MFSFLGGDDIMGDILDILDRREQKT